jgi:Tfp pilus assembly protein PilF
MRRRLLLGAMFSVCVSSGVFAEAPDDPAPRAPVESPPPPPEAISSEPITPHLPPVKQSDAAMGLGESRGAVRLYPDRPAARLTLAEALYRIGDLDAAIEEYRAAIKLDPNDARAHLQLGIVLAAKQNWRAASSVLHEAVRLDPGSTDAHYSLGSVQYSLGDRQAAMQSYRQALALQPYFPDARYRLALLLKLAGEDQEAAQLMEEAAVGGVPQAQFFLGNAYKIGQGIGKDLAKAIFWWTKAVDYGYQPAADSLSKLRRQALSAEQSTRKRQEAFDAFQRYRDKLWEEFHEYGQTEDGQTLGTTLLKDHRTEMAVPVLLKEGYALSETAQKELAGLYERGWDRLPPYADKILTCFEITAAEGFLPARRFLARIYGKGIGLPRDMSKAKALLKGLPKQELNALLDEIGRMP